MARSKEKNAPSLASFGDAAAFSGECIFKITDPNARYLAAFVKYIQGIELENPGSFEHVANIDGVLNSLLSESLEKRLKSIARKRGLKLEELMLILSENASTAEALLSLQEAERSLKEAEYQEILDHIPLEDMQGRLQLEEG